VQPETVNPEVYARVVPPLLRLNADLLTEMEVQETECNNLHAQIASHHSQVLFIWVRNLEWHGHAGIRGETPMQSGRNRNGRAICSGAT
jgi:hypothetical protein